MKKIIYSLTIFSILAISVMPVFADSVSTGLTRDTSGGADPIVKAKWEANVDRYTDALLDAGAQFLPSGQYQVNKTISMCAVVTDPDGLADVINVYADVFYPENIALGDSHVALSDQSGLGCGELMQEDSLMRLEKLEGIGLFCDDVRNLNNNLPTFNAGYDYDEICATDGELWKETAAVFCGQKDLSYEDPSGMYEVWAVAQDQNGLQGMLVNQFEYLPMTAFEADFDQIQYGNVRLNTHKIISGDLTWSALNQGPASVRNVGNTRLQMSVWQDDMGFGQTDGNWNVEYDARVGSFASFIVYDPEITMYINDELDLSELDEMDFSINISKFPPTHIGDVYTGNMILGARAVEHLLCGDPGPVVEMRHISLENKTENWEVISDDLTWGDIDYSHNDSSFNGLVTGQGLIPNSPYQISLNGPGGCTFTDDGFAGLGSTLFDSGYWNNNVDLEAVCLGTPGEGIYNMDLITSWYTVWTDANGDFVHNFDIALPAGDYVGVKVLVKKMLDPFVAPWSDFGPGYPSFNLYETATINFTVLP